MTEGHVLTIYTDGAARGNPGPAAYAFVITQPGKPAVEENGCLGSTTNNIAEYTAMVKALERARALGGRRLIVHSDSELMVKQMLGIYKVKNPGLQALYEDAKQLAREFDKVDYRHVRREHNKRADELCNQALDGLGSGGHEPPDKPARSHTSQSHHAGSRKLITLPPGARAEILDCLRTVAIAWAAGNANQPRPEEVWDQLWSILEDSGVLKTAH